MQNNMNQTAAMAIKAMLDEHAKKDADFAKDYKRKDKSVEEFVDLLVQSFIKKGARGAGAVFGSDESLIGQAVHYFHEDNVTEIDDASWGLYQQKPAAKPVATAKPAKPASAPIDDDDLEFDEPQPISDDELEFDE